jgi:bifunctional non-homologous end joining protein LigD
VPPLDAWQDGVVPMPFAPMLASTRPTRPLRGEWVLEAKFDDWRVIVAVDDTVRVWTRNGHELTDRLPELSPLVECCGGTFTVLDGELVARQGRAHDFYSVLPAVAARSRRVPLTFVAFDVLAFGELVIDKPYFERRALLDKLDLDGPAWCTTPQLHGSARHVLDACAEHDLEGIVAKRIDSRYRPGERSMDWLKLKTADWRATHAPRRHRH